MRDTIGQARDVRHDARDHGADDEGEQPGQEERQQDVAEEEEEAGELSDDIEEDGDDREDEQRAQQASVARSRLDEGAHRLAHVSWKPREPDHLNVPFGQRRPIFSRTSAMVASAIGRIRSAPAARTSSRRPGSAMNASYRSRASA
jgi:hypothetical protein